MRSTTPLKGKRTQKEITRNFLKSAHSFGTQVKPLRDYLNQLLKMVPQYSEPRKRQSLLDHICNAVVDHGIDGLKLHRGLFIQGVKVLGGDSTTDFSGFALDSSGFPKHYGDIFRLLRKFRRVEKRDVKTWSRGPSLVQGKDALISNIITEDFIVQPSDVEARQIQLLLSILKWPYSVKLEVSPTVKKVMLDKFSCDVSDPNTKVLNSSLQLGSRIAGEILPYLPRDYKEPLTFIPSERTYKGGRPGNNSDRRLPRSVTYATGIHNAGWSYNGPVGKTTVLSERAGKTRFITSYDGAINSSNLYEKARGILDNIPSDCSSDQTKGHVYLRQTTSSRVNQTAAQAKLIFSTDLDAFTDKIVLNTYRDLLELINSHDFLGVISAPIIVGESVVHPHRALMGLRGSFELASVVHHGIVLASGIKDYVMCGDDLAFEHEGFSALHRYEALCKYSGQSLNRKKTVISIDTGVFCGKVYFRGMDVSPVVPPLYSFSSDLNTFIASAGSFIASLAVNPGPFARAGSKLVLSFGRRFTGKFIPYYLPHKLGGIGIEKAKGLLRILSSKMNRLACKVPDEEFIIPYRTVRFPSEPVREVLHTPIRGNENWILFGFRNLLDKGATRRLTKTSRELKPPLLKDLHTILCYYYGIPT